MRILGLGEMAEQKGAVEWRKLHDKELHDLHFSQNV
jgi:hypothetical protein